MRIAFIGPPGAGKSTQAKRVARSLPYQNHSPRLSSGDLIRAEVRAATKIGRQVEGLYERGERVPDETILSLMLPRLRRAGGWMLDNFPANVAQAQALDDEIEGGGSGGLGHVILLEGPSDEELIERVLSGRVTSLATGEVYHTRNDPPPRPEDRSDPGPFERRSDDTEEGMRRHLEEYRRDAGELKAFYEERGVLHVVEARRSIQEVTAEVLEVLGHPESPGPHAAREGSPASQRPV